MLYPVELWVLVQGRRARGGGAGSGLGGGYCYSKRALRQAGLTGVFLVARANRRLSELVGLRVTGLDGLVTF